MLTQFHYTFSEEQDLLEPNSTIKLYQTRSFQQIQSQRKENIPKINQIKPHLKRYLYGLRYKQTQNSLKTKMPLIQSHLRKRLIKKRYVLERQQMILIQAQLRRKSAQKRYEPILNRWRIACELEETESNYIGYLRWMNKVYRELVKKGIIGQADQKKLIIGFVAIYQFNMVFYKEIEKCVQNWNSNPSLGKCFAGLIPYMGIYTPYINNYENQLNEIQRLSKKNQKFRRYLKRIPKKSYSKGLSFQSLTIMPIQRLPRYELLLRELIKYSKGEEKLSLLRAAEKMKKTTTKINEKKRSFEDMMKICEIQRAIKNTKKMNLVSPSRFLISKMYITFLENTLSCKSVLFLFNDLLLLCNVSKPFFKRKKKKRESYYLILSIRLTKIKKIVIQNLIWRLVYQNNNFTFIPCSQNMSSKNNVDNNHQLQDFTNFPKLLLKTKKERIKLIQTRRKTVMINKKSKISKKRHFKSKTLKK
ncbi:faciogenital dysplasia protein [Anaeramoeba flamelloides]|uniref:Faciogenital dysplasia protein n=1 Tax=Anaeramoeba flamelloides TaxID=1746091 RepID=A0ABQ8Z130_9EUKA|nr:faciogenital dysplasia protein [Anaeramoeba flamelloides]